MELFDNWGSRGLVLIVGVRLTNDSDDFGRLPPNDRQPDATFRSRSFPVNRTVNIIELRVEDITNLSEIYIDDLVITGSQGPLQLLLDESGPALDEAAALDSVLFTRDPFPIVNRANLLNLGPDPNTRVIIFVTNLQLAQGEASSSVVVNLIDSNNQTYDLAAEDVRAVPNFHFTQVIFRLPNNLAMGTCAIKVRAHGQTSNVGTIRIRI
jgi:hypothetical protein